MHRVLVVGAGSIGERHVRCFLDTGRAEVGICEPADETRKDVAERYDLCGAYDGPDAALAESWNAAVIATPAHTHISMASALAQAGLHLLIEKPLSTSMDGVMELQSEVRAQSLAAGVGYNHRAHPAAHAMKAAIDEGRFGAPLVLEVSRHACLAQQLPLVSRHRWTRTDRLDRDLALQRVLPRRTDQAHPALAERVPELELRRSSRGE